MTDAALHVGRRGAGPGGWFTVVKTALTGSVTREIRAAAESAARLAVPVATGRRVAVISPRRGMGQSTVCALVAMALASHRSDRVLLIDADTRLGSCSVLGVRSASSVRELAGHSASYQDFSSLSDGLGRSAGGLWVLAGVPAPGAAPLGVTEYRATTALRRFFAVTVIGCAGAFAALTETVVAESHVVVIVAAASPEGIREVSRAFRRLHRAVGADRHLHAVIAATVRSPIDLSPDFHRVVRDLHSDITVVVVPYDRRLATRPSGHRLEVDIATRMAIIEIAALALAKASGV